MCFVQLLKYTVHRTEHCTAKEVECQELDKGGTFQEDIVRYDVKEDVKTLT